tara:strand:+ start:71 stop:544 length:474 start_codon:yes stop_codon:yes gene_type:complete
MKISDRSEINNPCGFLKADEKDEIVYFKIKDMDIVERGAGEGKRCSSIQMKTFVDIINGIMVFNDENKYNIKYNFDNKKKKEIINTNGEKFIIKTSNASNLNDRENNIVDVKVGLDNLCIELELLLMYYEYIKKNNKRWYFYTLEFILNKQKITNRA